MANTRNADDVVKTLMQQADKKTITELLADAVNEGVRLGSQHERQRMTQRLMEATTDMAAVNLGEPIQRERRAKGPKGNVPCPFPKCVRPGVRPNNNFCKMHYDALPAKKRLELREAQKNRFKQQKSAQEAQEVQEDASKAQTAA